MMERMDEHDADDTLDLLYAKLGRALYEETKDEERFYLEHSDLYFAIASAEDASVSSDVSNAEA